MVPKAMHESNHTDPLLSGLIKRNGFTEIVNNYDFLFIQCITPCSTSSCNDFLIFFF